MFLLELLLGVVGTGRWLLPGIGRWLVEDEVGGASSPVVSSTFRCWSGFLFLPLFLLLVVGMIDFARYTMIGWTDDCLIPFLWRTDAMVRVVSPYN